MNYYSGYYPLYFSKSMAFVLNWKNAMARIVNPRDTLCIIQDSEDCAESACACYISDEARQKAYQKACALGFTSYVNASEPYKDLKVSIPCFPELAETEGYKNWVKSPLPNKDMMRVTPADFVKIVSAILPMVNSKKIPVSEVLKFDEFPFPDIIIYFNDNKNEDGEYCYYRVNPETKTIYVECETGLHNKLFKASFTVYGILDDAVQVDVGAKLIYISKYVDTEFFLETDESGELQYLNHVLWRFIYLNYFVKMIPAAVSHKKISKEVIVVEGKGGNRRYKSKVILLKDHSLNTKSYSISTIRRTIRCLCWGVRGHQRRLPNGKIIFIKPFRKGRERNNPDFYVSKDYLVDKGDPNHD